MSPGDLFWGPDASGAEEVGGGAGEGLALSKSSRAPLETRDMVGMLGMDKARQLCVPCQFSGKQSHKMPAFLNSLSFLGVSLAWSTDQQVSYLPWESPNLL